MSGAGRHDVVVVGGGPAGATASGLLAAAGHSVLVLERERFPRFHIGESLLPAELPIFERLGFDPSELPAVYKAGADFVDEETGRWARYMFAHGMDGTPGHAWQVERAPFDHALLRRAQALGAEVREGTRVLRADVREDGVTVVSEQGRHEARFVVDATGRDRLLARQHGAHERIEGVGRAAVFAHYSGLASEAVRELEETGNIIVLIRRDGWGWVIPLAAGRLSVGFVSARQGVVSREWFEQCAAASPLLERLTRGAERSEPQLLGDYSYRNAAMSGRRYGCIGDAAYFLDPVFSSGVALAMAGGEALADRLDQGLRRGCEDDPELLAPLEERMEHAFDVFHSLVRRFYHSRIVDNVFFCEDPDPALRRGLISVLACDVWRDDNPFQGMLMRSRASRRRATDPAAGGE